MKSNMFFFFFFFLLDIMGGNCCRKYALYDLNASLQIEIDKIIQVCKQLKMFFCLKF